MPEIYFDYNQTGLVMTFDETCLSSRLSPAAALP